MEVANEVVFEEESYYCLEMISESSATKKQKTLNLRLCFFIENGWKIIDGEVESKVSLQPAEFKRNIIAAYDLRLNGEFDYLQLFLTFLLLEFWKKLVSIVDHNLLKYSSTKNPVKATSVEELIQFYGMQMELENTFGNATFDIRQHLNQLSEKTGKKERIGQRRFLQIRNSINPTIEQFRELLEIRNKAAISTISRVSVVVCVMNIINAYQPLDTTKAKADQVGVPISVIYMPRKPHPNGLFLYLLATYVKCPIDQSRKLPVILDYEAHLRVGDTSPQEVVLKFLRRWKLASQPHVIADDAFGSTTVMEEI
jgi:hypothetical protein